jgi:hypothetical protein
MYRRHLVLLSSHRSGSPAGIAIAAGPYPDMTVAW